MMTFWGPAMPPPPQVLFQRVLFTMRTFCYHREGYNRAQPPVKTPSAHAGRPAWTGGRTPRGLLPLAQNVHAAHGPSPRISRSHNNKGATCIEQVDRPE